MKKLASSLLLLCGMATLLPAVGGEYAPKHIYLPPSIADNDFRCDTSHWSLSRMACTENVALFWAPGFGANIQSAPDLDGHRMTVDMANLLAKLEQFYGFFADTLQWSLPGSKAERYKMMCMLDYTLEGTAYGGTYDNFIGALWVTPGRLQDSTLNCIAHELGHCFQLQIMADSVGEAWGGSGIYEMASQWMLWQVNPNWQTDENYHLKAYQGLTHKAFLHLDNIYHSPYVLESWGELHGRGFIAELFRQGRTDEDPVATYKRLTGITQEQFNDEMYAQQARQAAWDFPRVRENAAPYRNQWHTALDTLGHNRYRVAPSNAPESYGFNFVAMPVPQPGQTLKVDFRGLPQAKGFAMEHPKRAGWRYGFIAVDADGTSHYEPAHSQRRATIAYTSPATAPEHLWLMVMGAPTEHIANPFPTDSLPAPRDQQYPYELRLH